MEVSKKLGLPRPTKKSIRSEFRSSHRPYPISGNQRIHGTNRTDQFRGSFQGDSDLAEAVETAVINKRAGGHGLILGRKAFQKPMKEGVEILHAVQDVYLDTGITIA
jgi:hypothetical protein